VILVDTSIWVEHFRHGHPGLAGVLERGLVLGHPWIRGEIALGHLSARREILRLLADLPQASVASPPEIFTLIDRHQLFGLGIGYVDTQLLAASLLTPDTRLWTADRHLAAAAARLDVAADPRP
jgi:predicted nucleic acid-binding protein